MSSTDQRTPERRLVNTMLAALKEELPATNEARINDAFDRLLAYAHTLSLARIANALEDMNRYGVDIDHRNTLTVYVDGP